MLDLCLGAIQIFRCSRTNTDFVDDFFGLVFILIISRGGSPLLLQKSLSRLIASHHFTRGSDQIVLSMPARLLSIIKAMDNLAPSLRRMADYFALQCATPKQARNLPLQKVKLSAMLFTAPLRNSI